MLTIRGKWYLANSILDSKWITIVVFFTVPGIRKSPVEAKLLKDGKALGVKDVEIIVQEDKVIMKLKKTVRSSSGLYQIKLSNAQGETNKDVNFNIQGILLPELKCSPLWLLTFVDS